MRCALPIRMVNEAGQGNLPMRRSLPTPSSPEEPGAVVPHAGICEGGVEQSASLPQSIKMKNPILLLLAFFVVAFAQAESTGLGISVKLDKDKVPRVTIVSSFKDLNATNVTVPEAAKKIAAFHIQGNAHWVGIVADDSDVRLDQYLPLLEAIAKNGRFMLFFVDGDDSENDYISKNIRRMIESGPGE